jgi:FkbM family methyltransferase
LRPGSHDLCTFDELFREDVYAAAVQAAQPIRTMIDLGANIGLASLYVLGRSPAARIVALEPDQDNYRLLVGNVRAYPQVQAWAAAAAAADGPVRFLAAPDHVSAGAVTHTGDPNARVVEGLSMATILERAGFSLVDLLKIDIEGGETELFKEPLDWLSRVRVLAIEFHGDSRRASNFDAVMSAAGFRIHDGSHTVVAVRR